MSAFKRIAAWLSANWAESRPEPSHPAVTLAILATLAPLPAAAQTANAANAKVTAISTLSKDFRLANRLAAVSKLNAPSSRAARRPHLAVTAGRAVPLVKAPVVKIAKETRLPTAFAARTMTKKTKPSAVVIDLAAAKSRVRANGARRAA